MSVRKVRIIGHRGAPAHAPENTLSSFRKALDMKVDYIELDVRMTKDGVLIVFHDSDLRRLTGVKRKVRECTWNFIRTLKVKGKERVLTLDEALEFLVGKAGLIVEVKEKDIVEKVIDSLRRHDVFSYDYDVYVSSFYHTVVKRALELESRLKGAVILVGEPIEPGDVARKARADVIALHYEYVDEEVVAKASKYDVKVIAWTVNDLPTYRRMAQLGVFGVATDDPSIPRMLTLI